MPSVMLDTTRKPDHEGKIMKDWKPEKPWAYPDGVLVCKADAPRPVWLAHRRTLIGGSDIGKMIGVGNPRYGGPFDLWAQKTGRAEDSSGNIATERGLIFEDAVIKLWAKMSAEFDIEYRRAGLIRSRAFPHLGATVDRLSICNMDGVGKRCVIEAKTQMDMTEWDDEDVPVPFQLQGGAQLAATGRDHVHFVVMGPRWRVEHRVLRRDEELIAGIGERAETFWADHVVTDQAPDVDYRSKDTLKRLYRGEPGKSVECDDEHAPHVAALLGATADLADAQQRVDTAAAILQHYMGDATELRWPSEGGEQGDVIATWNVGKTIDGANADWRREHPELVEQYTVPGPDVLDVAKLVENHPELLNGGGLRKRRTFTPKKPRAVRPTA